jgi:hypothetical protein
LSATDRNRSRIEFSFAEVGQEISSLLEIARKFLAPGAEGVLKQLAKDLESVRDQGDPKTATRWGIRQKQPLVTTVSEGAYAPGKRGALRIYGTLSFAWDIAPLGSKGKRTKFVLDGLASTRVALHHAAASDTTAGDIVTAWNLDIGAHDGPGVHFHVQLQHALEVPEHPKTLDVPRLPALVATPMLAFEMVLAELFQDDWSKEAARGGGAFLVWNGIQRRRLDAFLRWQTRALEVRRNGTPWSVLKAIKPEPTDCLG